MNWLLILVLAIIVLTTWMGYKKGLVKMVLSMLSIVITIAAVCIVTPAVSSYIKENTNAYEKIYEGVEEWLAKEDAFSTSANENELIEQLELPGVIKDLLAENNTVEKYAQMGVDSFNNYIAGTVADVIFRVIIFVISFAIVFVLIRLLFTAINLISKLPLINEVNKLAGILLGFAEGIIIVWLFFAIMTMFGSSEFGRTVLGQITGNEILSFIYNNNLIMKYILSII